MKYYLMIDIGASSGRHMLGHMQDGKIVYEEIHRFSMAQGSWKWHLGVLFRDIIEGMIKCREAGKIPESMGIDTFGVCHGFLDKYGDPIECSSLLLDGNELLKAREEKRYDFMSSRELYERTGNPDFAGSTIFQIMNTKERYPTMFDKAATILPMTDLLNYMLTGVVKSEYTYATTNCLVNVNTHNWDKDIIKAAGLDPGMFVDLTMPGTFVGKLLPKLKERVGFDLDVLQVASHDTASAYLAAPVMDENSIFISSGTWSLVGAESLTPVISDKSFERRLANEGNYEFRYRVLSNCSGTVMMQRVRRENNNKYTFDELMYMAKDARDFPSIIDVSNMALNFNSDSMENIVKENCRETEQRVPGTLGETMGCIYNSLAQGYKRTIGNLEDCMDKKFTSVNLFSGGCQDMYLNQLAADVTELPVYAGPVEAATIGSMLMQMIYDGTISGLDNARQLVDSSFDIHRFDPQT